MLAKMLSFVKLVVLLAVFKSTSPLPALDQIAEPSARIVNGYAVDIKEVPYQASLRRKVGSGWTHMCGAVVVSNRALLTAAHCVYYYESQPAQLQVAVGRTNKSSGGEIYELSKVIVHESYAVTTLEHDIGMLVTAQSISFSECVYNIAIAPVNLVLEAESEALVTGYGATSYEGSSSEVLLAAKVKLVCQEVCARAYLRLASISSGMICAHGSSPPRDACQGDSGGPLVAQGFLIGIVSFGEGCADTVYPGVYTRVSEYNPWTYGKLLQLHQRRN